MCYISGPSASLRTKAGGDGSVGMSVDIGTWVGDSISTREQLTKFVPPGQCSAENS